MLTATLPPGTAWAVPASTARALAFLRSVMSLMAAGAAGRRESAQPHHGRRAQPSQPAQPAAASRILQTLHLGLGVVPKTAFQDAK